MDNSVSFMPIVLSYISIYRTFRGVALSLLLSMVALGCSEDDPVVAQVGEATITKADYQRFVERLSPGLQSKKQGLEAARDYLQSIIDQELLMQEAQARGIDQSDAVVYKFEGMVRKRLAQRYQAEVLAPQIEVGRADIERAFVDKGYNRERQFSRILVRKRQDVDRVLAELRGGASFEMLAQRFAANDLFAKQGDGVVGWIGRTQAERFAIPLPTFISLTVGQIAEPMQLAGGWQIYRFAEDREAELIDYADEVAGAVSEEMWQDRLQMEVETLGRSFKLQLDAAGLQTLLAQEAPIGKLELSARNAKRALYRFEGGEIALGDFLYNMRSVGFNGRLQDSLQVVELARVALLPAFLMEAEARRRGWGREAQFAEWSERKRKGMIIQQLTTEETAARAVPSEAEIADYYEANKTRFRAAESARINQLIAPTRERALQLRQALENDRLIAELLAQPDIETHGDPAKDGALHLRKVVRARYPQLVDAVFAAPTGEWGGPVEVLDHFAVYRVVAKEGGQIQPFAEARERARAVVMQKRQGELIDAFIKRLREERKSQIVLYVERLG